MPQSNSMAVRWRRILMIRHETGNCYKFSKNGPIPTTLHMCHHSPYLNIPTWQYFLIVIAPPTADRKWYVLELTYCSKCVIYPTQIYIYIQLKSTQTALQTLVMLYCEDLEATWNDVALRAWWRLMFRQNTGSGHNFSVLGQSCLKLHRYIDSPTLNIYYEFR